VGEDTLPIPLFVDVFAMGAINGLRVSGSRMRRLRFFRQASPLTEIMGSSLDS